MCLRKLEVRLGVSGARMRGGSAPKALLEQLFLGPHGACDGTQSPLVPMPWLARAPGPGLPATLSVGMILGSGKGMAGASYLSMACRV